MAHGLQISIGQHSDKGRKAVNQDFHGVLVPDEPLLSTKGIAVALADGISSSEVSEVASESAVKSFLTDYYCTPDSWSVKSSAQRVIAATNSWLHAQTRRGQGRYDRDKGYVCTFSVVVFKSATAYLFHIGDSRIYRLTGAALEQLTEDHRVRVSSEQSYLGRALGVNSQVEIDHLAVQVEAGDIFVLATDGVYEFASARFIAETIHRHGDDLDHAAAEIVAEALRAGSADNLTTQIIRIDRLPDGEADELLGHALDLPAPPLPEAGAVLDGYRIIRELHASNRCHIYLATDIASGDIVALKIPSIDLRDDPDYRRRFMMEEWVARRIDSPHVLKPRTPSRKRSFLDVVTEYVDGQTLAQWMIDNPRPDIETVRGIVDQIAKGLRAFHRREMLHQDLRPANIMIDRTGTVKIIDFGSTSVIGVAELSWPDSRADILGTVQYTAPEYFTGEGGTPRSDLFSLGVMAYQMLTGQLPYGVQIARAGVRLQPRKLRYRSARELNDTVPVWIDRALQRAVHPDPLKRYEALSEFTFDLRHPKAGSMDGRTVPLAERNPLLFWKVLSALLTGAVLVLLAILLRLHG